MFVVFGFETDLANYECYFKMAYTRTKEVKAGLGLAENDVDCHSYRKGVNDLAPGVFRLFPSWLYSVSSHVLNEYSE